MEVETNKPPGVDGQVEDVDLIDFDADMVDLPEQVSTTEHVENQAALTSAFENIPDTNIPNEAPHESFTEASHEEEKTPAEALDHEDPLLNYLDEGAEADGTAPSNTAHEEEDFVEILHDLEEPTAPEDSLSAHEIDYDVEDLAEPSKPENVLSADHQPPEEPDLGQAAVDAASADHVEAAEPDEITWEEEDHGDDGHPGNDSNAASSHADLADAAEGDPAVTAHGDVDADEQDPVDVVDQNVVPHQDELATGDGDYSASGDGADLSSEVNEPEHAEDAVTAHESAEGSESGFPAITVCYKGDEFPLCSNDEDCFFTEITILDESVGKLLEGFRRELSNEIAEEDELIFQIDELGLEFAESTLADSLGSVTLNQIMEVFDLLVKNQDPDSSRVLYTYLFTKPNTTKRFESLVESATAGKGLEDVIRTFAAPVQPGAGSHAADEELDDALEGYDSLDEESREELEREETEHVIADFANDAVASSDHGEGDDHHDADHLIDEINGEETTHEDTDTAVHEASEVEPDPFLSLDLDEPADLDADLEEPVAEQTAPQGDDALVGDLEPIHSSRTSTLQDDEEAGSAQMNVTQAATETETVDLVQPADDDLLEEIDWREEPEADATQLDSSSVGGKRARDEDDEDGVEDEKDAKRIRP